MDAAYLKENVGDVLADGLAAVILSNPPDKVEYLALWLLNYVEKQSLNAEAAKVSATIAAADAKSDQLSAIQRHHETAQQKQAADAEAVKEQTITKALADAAQFEGVLEAFCERLKGITNASGVYVAERQPLKQSEHLKYVAASDENKFMIDQSLEKGKWITWDLFEKHRKKIINEDGEEVDDPDQLEAEAAEAAGAAAAAEAAADDEELTPEQRAAKAAKKAEDAKRAIVELKTVTVGNVLMGDNSDRVKFFKMPGTGSYHAVRVAYPALLNEATLELVPKTRLEIAEKNKKLAEQKEASELAAIMAVLQPFGKAPAKDGDEKGDGDQEDEDEKAEKAAAAAALALKKKKAKAKAKALAAGEKVKEDDDEEDEEAKARALGPKPIDVDLEGFAAAAVAAAAEDAAQDAADAEDEGMEDEERAQRKAKRTADRAAKLSAAEAMRKSVEEKQAAENALTMEQKVERAKKNKADQHARNELELLDVISKKTVEYALCLDTLNQNRRFTASEIADILKYAGLLQATLIRIDRKLFIDELARRDALAAYGKENEKSAEDVEAEIEEKRAQWIRDHKDQKDAKVSSEEMAFRYRQDIIRSLRANIAEFRTYNVFKGPLSVLQCLFYLLDYKQSAVADSDNVPDWKKMRMLFSDPLFNAIQAYDPTVEQVRTRANAYAKIKNLQKLLAGLTYEQLKVQNLPLAELFAYINDAFKLKKRARDERKKAAAALAAAEAKAKAEADKKAAKEAREKAKADAKAAAAASKAGGKASAAAAAATVDEDDEDADDDS